MRKSFLQSSWSRKAAIGSILTALCLGFALTACDDSSSAGGDNGSGGNRGGIPDTVETFMELSDYDCGKSQKCVATYLTEYHDMAVCDGDNGWVIGTLIEKMDCDFSSSSDKSSNSHDDDEAISSSDFAEVSSSSVKETKNSSDSKSSSSAKSGDSSSSEGGESDNGSIYDATTNILTDLRDGQTYKTVKIGNQWWMAENLNYEYKVNDSTYGNYCYKDSTQYCTKYGRLYTWGAVVDSAAQLSNDGAGCGYGKTCLPTYPVRGVCPEGWYLPPESKWYALFNAVGGQSVAGIKLKSTFGWKHPVDDSAHVNGLDAFGFSALPAGYRTGGGIYGSEGFSTDFWTSTMLNSSRAAYRINLGSEDFANVGSSDKDKAFSVRCVKDSD